MILDKGICTVFAKVDVTPPGGMPAYAYEVKHQGWYAELDFATVADWPTEDREERRVDARIRMVQNRAIGNHDVVVLENARTVEEGMELYEVTRAWHGHEQETGMPISDLTLERVSA